MQCLIGFESPEEEKDFRQRKKNNRRNYRKRKRKTQGFVKDFLKEIVDEPVEQDTISALKEFLVK